MCEDILVEVLQQVPLMDHKNVSHIVQSYIDEFVLDSPYRYFCDLLRRSYIDAYPMQWAKGWIGSRECEPHSGLLVIPQVDTTVEYNYELCHEDQPYEDLGWRETADIAIFLEYLKCHTNV